MQRGEKRGELVGDPPPFVCGEPAERGGVELPADEDRVAGERAVGGLVDVVGDADLYPRLEVAKQPRLVGEGIPVRLGLGRPEDERLVQDQDGVVPAMGQVTMGRPPQVRELCLDSSQERPFFHAKGACP